MLKGEVPFGIRVKGQSKTDAEKLGAVSAITLLGRVSGVNWLLNSSQVFSWEETAGRTRQLTKNEVMQGDNLKIIL